MGRVLIPLLGLAVVVYALADCIQTPDERVRHLPKAAWIGVIALVPVVGAIVWLVVGRARRAQFGPRRTRPPGPRGPDDDPDFLRGL